MSKSTDQYEISSCHTHEETGGYDVVKGNVRMHCNGEREARLLAAQLNKTVKEIMKGEKQVVPARPQPPILEKGDKFGGCAGGFVDTEPTAEPVVRTQPTPPNFYDRSAELFLEWLGTDTIGDPIAARPHVAEYLRKAMTESEVCRVCKESYQLKCYHPFHDRASRGECIHGESENCQKCAAAPVAVEPRRAEFEGVNMQEDVEVVALRKELTSLLNRHSQENDSNTPDFILAEYMLGCLGQFEIAVMRREDWYDCHHRPRGAAQRTEGAGQK